MDMRKIMWIAAMFVAALLVTAVVYAQVSSDYDLSWNTVDNGGGVSTGGDFGLSGSIGQPEAGSMAGGDFQLSGGFWFEAATGYRVMFPLVIKG